MDDDKGPAPRAAANAQHHHPLTMCVKATRKATGNKEETCEVTGDKEVTHEEKATRVGEATREEQATCEEEATRNVESTYDDNGTPPQDANG